MLISSNIELNFKRYLQYKMPFLILGELGAKNITKPDYCYNAGIKSVWSDSGNY